MTRPSPRPLLLVLALVPALALGACGSSDEDQVREAYDSFKQAIAARDGKAACAAFTPETRAAAAESAGFSRCEVLIDSLSANGRRRFAGTPVDKVELDGDRATLLFADGRAAPVTLVRIDGTWKVATGPAVGG